jgi:hypothetical protein
MRAPNLHELSRLYQNVATRDSELFFELADTLQSDYEIIAVQAPDGMDLDNDGDIGCYCLIPGPLESRGYVIRQFIDGHCSGETVYCRVILGRLYFKWEK